MKRDILGRRMGERPCQKKECLEKDQRIAELEKEIRAIRNAWCEEHGGSQDSSQCSKCKDRHIAGLERYKKAVEDAMKEMNETAESYTADDVYEEGFEHGFTEAMDLLHESLP